MEIMEILQEELRRFDDSLLSLPVSPNIFIFEERVRLVCFHCSRYNTKWTCPPRIPNLDYKQIMKEYTNGLLVYCQMPFKKEEFNDVRTESTNLVHKALLSLEKVLWEQNYPLAVSYIGGSCKLCENDCAADHCRNPYLSRIPIEATGINLISTLKQVGIEIKFPVTECLSRYGLLLW